VSQRVASLLNHLGLRDTTRKRRNPSLTPGPWAGSIVTTEGPPVQKMISQVRWDKAKAMVAWIHNQIISKGPSVEFKTLERHWGYLMYMGRTYPAMVPYLKGIHLTLDSWRPWRRDNGWKMTLAEIHTALEEKDDSITL